MVVVMTTCTHGLSELWKDRRVEDRGACYATHVLVTLAALARVTRLPSMTV